MAEFKQTSIDGRLIIQDSETASTAYISSNAAPAIFKLQDGSSVDYLIVKKSGGVIDLSGFQTIDGADLMTALHKNPLFALGIGDYFLDVDTLFTEAEDASDSTNSPVTDSDSSPAKTEDNGYYVPCSSQFDEVYQNLTGGPSNDLPHHDYKLIVRYYATNAVAGDLGIRVRNTTDGTNLLSSTNATTSGWNVFTSGSFTIDSNEDGDNIEVRVRKEKTDANEIRVDFFYLLPLEGILSGL